MNHLEIPLPENTPHANRAVKLPPFWTTNLQSWFTSAEGKFQLHNIANWVAHFGVPVTVTMDRVAQFTSAVEGCLHQPGHRLITAYVHVERVPRGILTFPGC
jgi:hypothetical protein